MNRKLFLRILFCALCASNIRAQEIIFLDAPEAPPTQKELETVANRIKDLDSENAETRRAAVLILGKYTRNSQALSAVIRMLTDMNADVRRSALVSLIESGAIPQQAAQPIVEMLDDEDVHIRRIASAAIPGMFFYLSGFDFDPSLGRTVRRELSPKAMNAISKSFSDTDAGVRKNMVSNFSYLNQYISPDLLLPLFEDQDRDIRLLAIEKGLSSIGQKLPEILQKLSKDSDPLVRLKLAESLRFSPRSSQNVQTLKALLSDESKPVRDAALCGLLVAGEFKDVAAIEKTLLDPQTDAKTAKMILPYLRQVGDKKTMLSILKKIFDNGPEHIRAFALDMALQIQGRDTKTEELLSYLGNPSGEIRRSAVNQILRMRPPNEELLKKMLSSEYVDLREAAINITALLDNAKAAEILEELLLDESDKIRVQAIEQFTRRRLKGHIEILTSSLEDESRAVSEAAVEGLLMLGTPEANAALARFIDEHGQHPLKEKIEQHLISRPTATPARRQYGPLIEQQ